MKRHKQRRVMIELLGVCLVALLCVADAAQAASLGCLPVDSQSAETVFNLDDSRMSDPLPVTRAVSVEASAAYQIVFSDPAPDGKHDEFLYPSPLSESDSSTQTNPRLGYKSGRCWIHGRSCGSPAKMMLLRGAPERQERQCPLKLHEISFLLAILNSQTLTVQTR